jgi:uncharacterized protein YbbK (DUF523 family)
MLLAHDHAAVAALREPTEHDPWRVLVSGCLAGWGCGVDGTDYGLTRARGGWWSSPKLRLLPFCPEQHALGTPRSMPDIHGGDGVDVLAGRARVLDEHGRDLTAAMLDGARAMLAFARANQAELAILTDMSAACGSQVISKDGRLVPDRRYQRGVGVATALLLEAAIPVLSQRDQRTLALLRARLEPGWQAPPDARDHHEHPWVLVNLPGEHPRV